MNIGLFEFIACLNCNCDSSPHRKIKLPSDLFMYMMRSALLASARIRSWLRDYDSLHSLSLFLIYIQIGCSLVGSLGALYNGVLVINLVIALFALIAIESNSQSLGRTYAVLLFCSIVLDVMWLILFSREIWSMPPDERKPLIVLSVKLSLWMEIFGFAVRLLSSLLWFQIYRLGVSVVNGTAYRDADLDLRQSFLNPTAIAPVVIDQDSRPDDMLGGSIYDPCYHSSLFRDVDNDGYAYVGNVVGENSSPPFQAS